MALVTKLSEIKKETYRVHGPVECAYSILTADDGRKLLQLDTHGSAERQIPGKISQTLQFDETSARALKAVLERAFPG